ncbi:unnamed protein product [Rotaria magnacalcarata]|uniref:Uncharacterized protein n=1 Tax=Rotaria magnacalcarata TaxID=392030 RepID=A0A814GLT2_9BILA|nr:unnamed protein product [Rotaria magnacalcarata]CAF1253621.1 unnamed protein product [Rotaria magnacalcarata]CAF1923146.1 unnamed protein product [Rotaria magnacalcarata]CAF1932258.1 unnamed protein product [Rotaria magnacalcarata]CAF1967723.1 unnamed protein product [Rotaria magnacalcarata]
MSRSYPGVPVIVAQPTLQYHDPFRSMNNEWNVGLCNCCDNVSQCCYAYWCWCCFVNSLANTIGESTSSCLCVSYSLAMYRMKVRSVLRIRGDTYTDYCVTTCCPFCAGLQMRNELKHYGIS